MIGKLKSVLMACIYLAMLSQHVSAQIPPSTPLPDLLEAKNEAREQSAARQQLDTLIWAGEVEAQRYEQVFVEFWDSLRASGQPFLSLSKLPFNTLYLGERESQEALAHDIKLSHYGPGSNSLSYDDWKNKLVDLSIQGYRLVQSEWHHEHFLAASEQQAAQSQINAVLHIARDKPAHRISVEARIEISWAPSESVFTAPSIDSVKLLAVRLLEREASPVFTEVFRIKGDQRKPRILPLLVYDLDSDGYSEIILGGQNAIVKNKGNGEFELQQLNEKEYSLYDAGVVADFTGDGHPDLISIDSRNRPIIMQGDESGTFSQPATQVAEIEFNLPKAMTAGDIDQDGDLDLFIGNYKYAYRQGQMPTPYYDANDGYPAALLENDGNGHFVDITEQAGLEKKRYRRSYSSSFVDLDNDQDLDLIVVSDYAGLDTYLNDGKGHFTDISEQFGLDRHAFGMGHTFADYNNDGLLDFYVIGMSSTTARRLENLGLNREDKPEHNAMRKVMGYGNRMFLNSGNGFELAPFNSNVARTGWSWGASSFDFDNDGDKDIYVTNGHYSGESSQDYCTTFWRHDIYEEGSQSNIAKDVLFQLETTDLRQARISWNGFEHKQLLMNVSGEGFINIAFLMGIAFEYDARSVVSDDLDGDGRMDLMVVEFATEGLDQNSYTLHVYRNAMPDIGHWIGVRLDESTKNGSPVGARITLKTKMGEQITQFVNGDSFSAQHPNTAHFGLGDENQVEFIEIKWLNGQVQRLDKPEIDRYHHIASG